MTDAAQIPPAPAPKPPSLTISVLPSGRYEIDYHALPADPVILCGLLRVAERMILDQIGPKKSPLVLQNGPQLQLPPGLGRHLANGGRR